MKYSTTHVRHDPSHCLAPGLFKSLKKGERKNKKLDIKYNYGDEITVRFIGFEPLGSDDMRVLQTIVAMSSISNMIIDKESPEDGKAGELKNLLSLKKVDHSWQSKALKTTMYAIIKEMGYASCGKREQNQVMNSIRRLSNVTMIYSKGNIEWSTHLLSYAIDKVDGKLYLANNPKITEAVLGKSGYTHISMREIRILKNDSSRILHQRLCAIIDPGKKKKVTASTLIEYIWGEIEEKTPVFRVRKMRLRKSLDEIKSTRSWQIKECSKDLFLIERFSLQNEALLH